MSTPSTSTSSEAPSSATHATPPSPAALAEDFDTPLGNIFRKLPTDHREAVVDCALQRREQAPQTLRKSFDAALSQGVRIKGYRDPRKAPHGKLLPCVGHEVANGNDRVAGAVLRVWEDAHKPLRKLVSQHLDRIGIEPVKPDYKAQLFRAAWTEDHWWEHAETLGNGQQEYSLDDIGLMLCLVSGRMPISSEDCIGSEFFQNLLSQIRESPCDSCSWTDAYAFADAVRHVADEKFLELIDNQVDTVRQALDELRARFEQELAYLDIGIENWFDQVREHMDAVPDAIQIIERLADGLEEYQPLHPQAPSRDEERRRSRQRQGAEDALLAVADEWHKLMKRAKAERAKAECAKAEAVGEDHAEYRLAGGAEAVPKAEHDQVVAERDQLRTELDGVRDENARIGKKADDAADARKHMHDENSELKRQLTETQGAVRYWRRQFVDLKGRAKLEDEDEPLPPPASLSEAIDRAGQQFADELLFSLNSKSRKNNAFEKPDEVFDALAWLATEFRLVRPNPGANPDFNRMIKEACPGWFYKPNQTETTMGQFSEWYRTTVDGKIYELANHIGKGNSFNPKSTIRIAFAWDEELGKVVVGFVVLHQKNRQS